ncbi:hypothetical protein [Massilia sp. TWP1-3-3]|uniref:hypothetical protein n=1 Tax=Massilia sp. TWP1-3-3 TaxID=2804573 RepID=UPI003CE7BCFF
MHQYKKIALSAVLVAAMMALAGAIAPARELVRARADSEAAWHDIVRIHASRIEAASAALDAERTIDAAPARSSLARARAVRADDSVLYDAQRINHYKQQQGELTGALHMLAAGEHGGAGALDALRERLVRDEVALSAARARYGEASARYQSIIRTATGATLVAVLRYPELPAAL